MTTEVIAKDLFIGRDSEGSRVFVDIELRDRRGDFQTVDHERIGFITELSIMGSTIAKGRRDIDSCGQLIDSVRDVARKAVSEPVGSRRDLRTLADIWERWHLNGMNAGCAHQKPVGDTPEERLRKTPACGATGYRWGSAWLAEDLPEDVAGELRRIAAALR